MKTNTSISILSIFLSPLLITPSFAQSITKSKIEEAYRLFEHDPALKNGTASLTVLNGTTGEPIFQQNETVGLATASTMKIITAATAFDVLGKDFKFKTTLYYTGSIQENGILDGDIIIHGTGDPTLGSSRYPESSEEQLLNKWVYVIQNAGIKEIKGRVIGDDSLYGGYKVPGGWIWTDIGNYYGAGVSSLNWRENAVGVVFNPSEKIGSPAAIQKLTADLSYLQIINEVTTGKNESGDNVYAYSGPYASQVYIRGTYGADLKKTIEIAVPDPAYDVAFQLSKSLTNAGIKTANPPSNSRSIVTTDIEKHSLDIHESAPLSEIIYWFNQKSINLYGEALLKAIAYQTAQKTETSDGASCVQKYWENKLKINPNELNSCDGSGLSPQNRVTTGAMAKIMQYTQSQSWFPEFYKSLPEYNKMKMKSGTIGGALGYTGIQTNSMGEKFTFTLLVNNYSGSTSAMRKQMFQLLDTLK
ncbi:D-alanyl-D-alanine carboxypeptidase/D-alanyl-D-alanine-endopeptidase [Sphingobacterium sp. SRCM116780]|uniref:D-alanyl-D-alanine carboxypeptidase/D-alanyl-D-alanine endopeptidase n=1 Tax=Sphingobacterium sp. SRCM116780 TaxID=2907623 RepID=UPI001F1E48BC|nr:D-alanyl-D-alanine carboxypeptidase/D-alanyl-D-alanine-endopeptidase [Sphingobacterium sp. SRCM116780]UIR55288.1 D-alanyl-D-alanine carboxypeptidase/D-alanyl-D-alanine-endopeptidase [Sphingobacterium sp. SRCM116780]